jgi:polar amino acid transport system substrate-binding protein
MARLAEQAGGRVMGLFHEEITPSKIMTQASLENALKVNLTIGGSLNSVLHPPAVAHELGLRVDYSDFDRLSREIPHLANIEPAGPHYVVELDEAGGIPGIMKSLAALLDGTPLTVTGTTVAKNLETAAVFSPEIIRPLSNPVHPYGGIAVLRGNLAEQGAVIKQVAVKESLWRFSGKAKAFDSEEEALVALEGKRGEDPRNSGAVRQTMEIGPSVIAAFTTTGKLRAAINLGNPVLAGKNPTTGEPYGVSVDLARAFAKRLGVNLELVVFDSAAKSVEAVTNERADIGFFAVDPVRGANIAYTAPYVLIEGCYLVRQVSPIRSNDDVDCAGNRVAAGTGSAYDLYLTRELKHARIVRAPTSPSVVDTFLEQGLEVAAGVKQQLEADAQRIPGLRLLDGRFMVIQQAMGTARTRGHEASRCLGEFVEEMKASGFVAQALRSHRIDGASVAPPAR